MTVELVVCTTMLVFGGWGSLPQNKNALDQLSFVLEGALLCGLREALRGRLVLGGCAKSLCTGAKWTTFIRKQSEVRHP